MIIVLAFSSLVRIRRFLIILDDVDILFLVCSISCEKIRYFKSVNVSLRTLSVIFIFSAQKLE